MTIISFRPLHLYVVEKGMDEKFQYPDKLTQHQSTCASYVPSHTKACIIHEVAASRTWISWADEVEPTVYGK